LQGPAGQHAPGKVAARGNGEQLRYNELASHATPKALLERPSKAVAAATAMHKQPASGAGVAATHIARMTQVPKPALGSEPLQPAMVGPMIHRWV